MEFRYQAVVLSKRDINETDRIYTFYTGEKGKIQAIAKGVRKSQARLAGSLENFNFVDLALAKGRGTGQVTGAIIEENFSCLRQNLESLHCVFDAIKIFQQVVGWEERDLHVFLLLLSYLKTMDGLSGENRESQKMLVSYGFISKLLEMSGYRIDVAACLYCAQPFFHPENYFSAYEGGILCVDCGKQKAQTVKINPNSIKLLRIFSSNTISSLPKLSVERQDMDNLNLILREFLRWNINK